MGALMRLLLALFAFLVLALSPLAMPAEARAMDDHCTEMADMAHHGDKPDPSSPQPVKLAARRCLQRCLKPKR
jgi:hypothetical protein